MPSPDGVLTALCADFARRRAGAITVALAPGAGLSDTDVAWVADAADSLARLVVHAGAGAPAAAALAEHAARLAEASPGRRREFGERMRVLAAEAEASLAEPAAAGCAGDVPLVAIAEAGREDARRAAAARGTAVAVDLAEVPAGIGVPAAAAGALVDALGRVMRDSVVFGTPEGGAIRVVAHAERGSVTVVVSDRGGGVEGGARLHPDRAAGLHAAGGCLAAVGGELSVGVGPWGGASVTVVLPLRRGPGRLRWS